MRKALSEMDLDELWRLFPIRLEPWREEWAQWYLEEAEALWQLLPDGHICRIEHIGSTAIGGIWAKPIVDILVELNAGREITEAGSHLEQGGYLLMSADASRRSYNKGYTLEGFAERIFHIHLRQEGDHDELYFRDCLRADRQAAGEYERLKLRLWREYEYDRNGYSSAKGAFVRQYTAVGRGKFQGRYERG